MSLESALRTLLTTNAPVAAIIGDRVFPLAVESPTSPYIVYEIRAAADTFTRSGYTGLFERRVSLNIVAGEYDDAVALAELVKAALPLWGVTVAGIRFKMMRRDDERDFLSVAEGQVTPVGRQLDYTVVYSVE